MEIPTIQSGTTNATNDLPLKGSPVLDFSHFLSGPLATLRLADMGARVIKIERPGAGDLGRTLYLSDTDINGENTLFHAINRNKERFAADLKDPSDMEKLRHLIARADVMVQNFRPGVIQRLKLQYESVSQSNPRMVYGSISGYGEAGEWRDRPGQDLLAQARSGIMWLSGDEGDPPTPFSLAIADMLTGHNLCQGILACLVRRGITGHGGHVETSVLQSLLAFSFEVFTAYMNDGRRPPRRGAFRNAHSYLAAPYGVYDTKNGHLALAMTHLPSLGTLLGIPELTQIKDSAGGFKRRDEIKRLIADRLRGETTEYWLGILDAADIWCSEVLDWPKLLESGGFQELRMLQTLANGKGLEILTTRCPFRIDGEVLSSAKLAAKVGEQTAAIVEEFGL